MFSNMSLMFVDFSPSPKGYKTQLSFEFLFIDTANINGPIRDELAKIKAAV